MKENGRSGTNKRYLMRRLGFNLHLYAALIAGAFIVVLGLTGSIMAFEPEIDHVLHWRLSLVIEKHSSSPSARANPPPRLISAEQAGRRTRALIARRLPGADRQSGRRFRSAASSALSGAARAGAALSAQNKMRRPVPTCSCGLHPGSRIPGDAQRSAARIR